MFMYHEPHYRNRLCAEAQTGTFPTFQGYTFEGRRTEQKRKLNHVIVVAGKYWTR